MLNTIHCIIIKSKIRLTTLDYIKNKIRLNTIYYIRNKRRSNAEIHYIRSKIVTRYYKSVNLFWRVFGEEERKEKERRLECSWMNQ